MTDATDATDLTVPDVMRIYDDQVEGGLACLVCGALVSRGGDFRRVHWDWHEASNGA